jgi:hypothetical protein
MVTQFIRWYGAARPAFRSRAGPPTGRVMIPTTIPRWPDARFFFESLHADSAG